MPNKVRTSIFALSLAVALAALFCFLATPKLAAQSSNQFALFRKPTISKTQIAFSYGGDLWIVDRNGGEARRLTSDIGIEIDPSFRPTARMIAFTGEYDGNEDVYVIPAAGGVPKRLTIASQVRDQVVGWTRDGKRILFRSCAHSAMPAISSSTLLASPAVCPKCCPADGLRRLVFARQLASRLRSVHEFQ